MEFWRYMLCLLAMYNIFLLLSRSLFVKYYANQLYPYAAFEFRNTSRTGKEESETREEKKTKIRSL
jgi:hypothetical protein